MAATKKTGSISPVPTTGQTDRPSELDEITPQIQGFKYPITTREDLVTRLVAGHKYFYRGKQISTNQMIAKMPDAFFPIASQDDFLKKISANITPRAPVLIVDTIILKTHPTSVKSPALTKGQGKS
jgi:hypothetical protein